MVDASGRTGVLAKKLGRHDPDPLLRNIAVHAHFEGVPREGGRGDIRMLLRPDMGWLWLIPITPEIMSVGAVIPQRVYGREAKASAEESLAHFIQPRWARSRCSRRRAGHADPLRRGLLVPRHPPGGRPLGDRG